MPWSMSTQKWKMEKATLSFRIYKILQILKRFAGTFHRAQTLKLGGVNHNKQTNKKAVTSKKDTILLKWRIVSRKHQPSWLLNSFKTLIKIHCLRKMHIKSFKSWYLMTTNLILLLNDDISGLIICSQY